MARQSNTRAAHGDGSIRKRSNGRWEARYTAGRNPGTGKQIRRSVYADTQSEVRQKLREVTKEIDDNLYIEPKKMTVGEWLDIWVKDYLGDLKSTTRRAYSDHVKHQIKPNLGAVPLQKLFTHDVQSFINSLATSGRKLQRGQKKKAHPGLSPKSIKNIHAVLRASLNQAIVLSYIKVNPAVSCILPRIQKKEMRILQDDEITAFEDAVENHRYKTLFLLMLYTGLRRGEALGLTWKCIDFDGNTILINKQLQRDRVNGGELTLVSPKNDKQRRLAPPLTVFRLLQEHKEQQAEKQAQALELWNNTGLVFTNEVGEALDPDAVYSAYKKLLTENNLPDIRLHDLRHTAATEMLRCGDNVNTVSQALGHFSAGFTLDTYGHVTEQMRRDSADRMELRINSRRKSG